MLFILPFEGLEKVLNDSKYLFDVPSQSTWEYKYQLPDFSGFPAFFSLGLGLGQFAIKESNPDKYLGKGEFAFSNKNEHYLIAWSDNADETSPYKLSVFEKPTNRRTNTYRVSLFTNTNAEVFINGEAHINSEGKPFKTEKGQLSHRLGV